MSLILKKKERGYQSNIIRISIIIIIKKFQVIFFLNFELRQRVHKKKFYI
jgi:hypothetical protein